MLRLIAEARLPLGSPRSLLRMLVQHVAPSLSCRSSRFSPPSSLLIGVELSPCILAASLPVRARLYICRPT